MEEAHYQYFMLRNKYYKAWPADSLVHVESIILDQSHTKINEINKKLMAHVHENTNTVHVSQVQTITT